MEILIDLLLSGIFDVLIEIGQRGFGASLRRNRRAHPVVSGASALVLGGCIGGVSVWLWPVRFFAPGPVPGASLIVTPIVNGLLMRWYGSWQQGRGRQPFFLATFWGGALFGLGVSLVRFLTVSAR